MDTIPLLILVIAVVLVVVFVALLVFRAMMYGRLPGSVQPVEPIEVDGVVAAEHLSSAIRVKTISEADHSRTDYETFDQMRSTLEHIYPRVHAVLKREVVSEHSLLYTWMGSNLDLEPALLMAHMDVVPVDPNSQGEWTHPPFDGVIADDMVWGRGALDCKSTMISILEALETLIKADFTPERTLYIAFGHDEEVGGLEGAACIAELLEKRGVKLMAVLDEGGALMSGNAIPGVDLPVGLIGIAEKGYVTLELRVEGRGGHSSTPPPHTAIGVLARALTRLEANPMPVRLSMARLMFEELGAFLPLSMRLMLANLWLLKPLAVRKFSASPVTNALMRTTTAVTIIEGGVKDNIVPASARAAVNFRIMPGERVEDVVEHVRKVIKDDAVQISIPRSNGWNPSMVSPIDSSEYRSLSDTVRELYPEAVLTPYLVLGATDSRHFARLTSSVYRFSPYMLNEELMHTIHGTNERIGVEALATMVQFYARLINVWAGSKA